MQKDDYYPFGGSFNAYTDPGTAQQNYLCNGVRFNQTSQLYETAFRTYDPYLGRFNPIDPLTAVVPGLSPYHFGFNNPVRYSDPMGLMGLMGQDEGIWGTGNTHASKNPSGGFTGPGSGKHWSDKYRDPFHNWMSMDTDGFRDFYGLDDGFGGTNFERAMELTGSFTAIGSSQGGSFFYGVNGIGDGNGNIIPGTEEYILYQHITHRGPFIGAGNRNGYSADQSVWVPDWSHIGNTLTAGGIAYYSFEKSISNSTYWIDANGNKKSTELLKKGSNGKHVRGVQGLRNGQAAAANAASKYAVAGKVVGGLGMGITLIQYGTGQISGFETSVDLIMGGIGFTPLAPISLMYFGGKILFEYSSGYTLFEKPSGH